ncbi:MAG: PorV/PorQ family protein [Calditrichaeota bacterium]|nr:PorV/PorQ family protein [Calditrichota bacterium]RQW03952.1 MAG: PorV/PorQ family protein [Calditrichota bacterium]
MKTFTLIIVFFFITFLMQPVLAGEESGGYAGSFLDWGAGARAISMGKSFTGIADDGTALIWNPAGLAQVSSSEFSAMHALIFEDRSQNFLALSYPLNRLTISAGWMRFGVSDVQERSTTGELTGTFDDSENIFMLGSGYQVLSIPTLTLNAGLTAKYFYHSLYEYHASGIGIDLGVLSAFHLTGLVEQISAGIAIQNLGAKLKWDTESEHEDNIPATIRFGSALSIRPIPFKLALDLEKKENQDIRIHAGAEYSFTILALRAGLDHDKLTAGAGLMMELGRIGFGLDYALSSDEVSSDPLHFFSLRFRF